MMHANVCLVADGRSDVVVPFRSERDTPDTRKLDMVQ